MNTKVKYNFEEDIFFAREGKIDTSFQIENFVFDLDKNNNIKGIELINASKLFGISKSFLKNMSEAEIKLIVSEKYVHIDIKIKTRIRNTDNTSSINIERLRPEFLNQTELHLAIA